MKRILFAGSLALAACGQALAADLPPVQAPRAPAAYVPTTAPTYNWGGVYIGVNGGYGFGSSTWTDPNNPASTTSGSFDLNGWLAGGTIGANFQASQFVFGVEGDLDWSNIKNSSNNNAANAFCTGLTNVAATAALGANCQTQNTYFGTARARVGFAADRVLIFATGGAAFGNIQAGLSGGPIGAPTFDTTNKVGWTGGGELEVAFADNWTGKIEYLYADLGSGTCTTGTNCGFYGTPAATTPGNNSVKFTTSVVRAGINFKFGGGY